MKLNLIDLYNKSDSRGNLVVAESQQNIPFEIKRVYCLYGLSVKPRGFHAHKELRQVIVCLSGSCKLILEDSESQEIIHLTANGKGVFIDKLVWHEMHDFINNCVLMVLASGWYDESDYIRSSSEFKKLIST